MTCLSSLGRVETGAQTVAVGCPEVIRRKCISCNVLWCRVDGWDWLGVGKGMRLSGRRNRSGSILMTVGSLDILDIGIDMASTRRITMAPLLAAAALGVMVGLGAFTFHEARGTSYLSNGLQTSSGAS